MSTRKSPRSPSVGHFVRWSNWAMMSSFNRQRSRDHDGRGLFSEDSVWHLLDAARRKAFDVLVVSEIRSISRQQVEVLVIYQELLKYGIRLETVTEKFGTDAMSKAILGLRAMFTEIEV